MLGIELSPAASRIVSLDTSERRAADADTRVDSFSILSPAGPDRAAALARHANQDAAVVVWEASSDHRRVVVRRGSYEAMRAEAIEALADAGVRTGGMLVDVVEAGTPDGDRRKRIVVVSLADAAAVAAATRPIVAANIRVRSIVTPAAALASMARLRHGHAHTTADAYVALGETASCIAIVRDGALVAARELGWGFHTAGAIPSWRREDIALRLAEELAAFFGALGSSVGAVGQVCVCGGLLDLRTMTMPLMERLDVEVETLDSLFGIEPERLPEPADEFRDRSAELRVAWAAAADWPSPINLLRARRRRRTRALLVRAAMVAGAAIAPVVGWKVLRTPAPAVPVTARRSPPPAPAIEPKRVASPERSPVEPAPRRLAPPPAPSMEPPRVAAALSPRTTVLPPPPEPSIPFDATLGTILSSSDRQLAIIDGRIVGVGDDVRGARVVEIGPSAVMLRDGLGRLRRLTVSPAHP